jgi:hypothetical protein
MFIQCTHSPQDLLHARTEAADPRGSIFLVNRRIAKASVRKKHGTEGEERIDVHAAPTWRVEPLPRVPEGPRILGMKKRVIKWSRSVQLSFTTETRMEDWSLSVVTCVNGVENRESVPTNVPVGQRDI